VTRLAGNEFGSPASENEIELSLFGPGYGESIVLHLGHGDWAIIDSCINKNKEPAPLHYLRAIGVNPSIAVKLIVATHWHDDHVRGIAAVVRDCPNAQFFCSDALKTEEFRSLVCSLKERSMMKSTSGVKEFGDVMSVLEKRIDAKEKFGTPKWAVVDRRIWNRVPSESKSVSAEVWSLSPSDASITLAKREIGSLIPQAGDSKLRVPSKSPNHLAVALWIKVGNHCLLLGSDLENTSDPSTGWISILESTARPNEKASIFKVPHHGSKTAFEERVWQDMLYVKPVAVLTPNIRGRTSLPTLGDVEKIKGLSGQAYLTAKPRTKVRKDRHNIVNKAIKETVLSIHDVPASTGVIRLRKVASGSPRDPWKVNLFGSALDLSTIQA